MLLIKKRYRLGSYDVSASPPEQNCAGIDARRWRPAEGFYWNTGDHPFAVAHINPRDHVLGVVHGPALRRRGRRSGGLGWTAGRCHLEGHRLCSDEGSNHRRQS